MQLAQYLQQEKLSPAQFAAKLGKPASTVSRILKDLRSPGLGLMDEIAKATDGQVMPNDFLNGHRESEAIKEGAA